MLIPKQRNMFHLNTGILKITKPKFGCFFGQKSNSENGERREKNIKQRPNDDVSKVTSEIHVHTSKVGNAVYIAVVHNATLK